MRAGGFEQRILSKSAILPRLVSPIDDRCPGHRARSQAASNSGLSRSDLVLWPVASLAAAQANVGLAGIAELTETDPNLRI